MQCVQWNSRRFRAHKLVWCSAERRPVRRNATMPNRIRMCADRIVDAMQRFVRDALDTGTVPLLQPNRIHLNAAADPMEAHWKSDTKVEITSVLSALLDVNTYLSTQWAAVIAQFSFSKAAPHLCKYVDVRHWRSEICHGQRPNDAFEPPTIRGSGYIRLPHTAITINVEFINGVIIFN